MRAVANVGYLSSLSREKIRESGKVTVLLIF